MKPLTKYFFQFLTLFALTACVLPEKTNYEISFEKDSFKVSYQGLLTADLVEFDQNKEEAEKFIIQIFQQLGAAAKELNLVSLEKVNQLKIKFSHQQKFVFSESEKNQKTFLNLKNESPVELYVISKNNKTEYLFSHRVLDSEGKMSSRYENNKLKYSGDFAVHVSENFSVLSHNSSNVKNLTNGGKSYHWSIDTQTELTPKILIVKK